MSSKYVCRSVNTRLIACVLAAIPLAAQSLPEVFARMDKSAKGFNSVTADIRQTAHTAIVNDDSTESGVFRLRKSKSDTNLLIDYTTPQAKTVSLASGDLSVYLPKARSVQVYDIRSRRSVLEQGLLLGFGATSAEVKDKYEVTYIGQESVGGQASNHIRLIPKSQEVLKTIRSADLWISDSQGVPLQQKASTSGTGDFILIEYSNIKINPSIADKDLKLNLPKGVQTTKVGK